MKIKQSVNKTKIIFEYSNKSTLPWDTVYLDKSPINILIELKDGKKIYSKDIRLMTINVKKGEQE